MKNEIIIATVLLLSVFVIKPIHSQDLNIPNKQHEFRIDALGPALIFEQRLMHNFTLALDAGAITSVKADMENKKGHLFIKPYLRIEPRFYTKILLKNDHSHELRGEFISFQSRFGTGTRRDKPWQTFGPVIGQTCNIGKKGYLQGSIGYGLLHAVGDLSGTFLVDLGLGLAF